MPARTGSIIPKMLAVEALKSFKPLITNRYGAIVPITTIHRIKTHPGSE
jgi:hypothetical protein